MNSDYLRTPATRRDLLGQAAVMTVLVVLVIIGATLMGIRLHQQQETVRDRAEKLRAELELAWDSLDAQSEQLKQVDVIVDRTVEKLESVPAQAQVTRRQVRRQVQTVVREVPVPGPVRRVEGPPRPSLPVRAPTPRPNRPARPDRPTRPDRPGVIVPELPAKIVPAPTPAPAPPPIVQPPIVEPPRPGNKPPHATCPPANKHCS